VVPAVESSPTSDNTFEIIAETTFDGASGSLDISGRACTPTGLACAAVVFVSVVCRAWVPGGAVTDVTAKGVSRVVEKRSADTCIFDTDGDFAAAFVDEPNAIDDELLDNFGSCCSLFFDGNGFGGTSNLAPDEGDELVRGPPLLCTTPLRGSLVTDAPGDTDPDAAVGGVTVTVGLGGDGEAADVGSGTDADNEPPGDELVLGDEDPDELPVGVSSAHAADVPSDNAAPTPSAAANPPTRPTKHAALMTASKGQSRVCKARGHRVLCWESSLGSRMASSVVQYWFPRAGGRQLLSRL
jgi:hypothetical protein